VKEWFNIAPFLADKIHRTKKDSPWLHPFTCPAGCGPGKQVFWIPRSGLIVDFKSKLDYRSRSYSNGVLKPTNLVQNPQYRYSYLWNMFYIYERLLILYTAPFIVRLEVKDQMATTKFSSFVTLERTLSRLRRSFHISFLSLVIFCSSCLPRSSMSYKADNPNLNLGLRPSIEILSA
jgi:hypothetical protein